MIFHCIFSTFAQGQHSLNQGKLKYTECLKLYLLTLIPVVRTGRWIGERSVGG